MGVPAHLPAAFAAAAVGALAMAQPASLASETPPSLTGTNALAASGSPAAPAYANGAGLRFAGRGTSVAAVGVLPVAGPDPVETGGSAGVLGAAVGVGLPLCGDLPSTLRFGGGEGWPTVPCRVEAGAGIVLQRETVIVERPGARPSVSGGPRVPGGGVRPRASGRATAAPSPAPARAPARVRVVRRGPAPVSGKGAVKAAAAQPAPGPDYVGRPVKAARVLVPFRRDPLKQVLGLVVVSTVVAGFTNALFVGRRG
ncbi:hypothetical protein [Actinomadura kijaniata]|uniref:hypothetical protein n=1 Tax=Actinomadura kijaniata TaxID=46161 RepID=UPI00082B3EF5|nr:hypothetical protein [Actinomadura kijaniata]